MRYSWELEPIFKKTNYSEDFRSFSDPNRLKMPKTYGGKFWVDGADVHINSSVMNHWYYLLVNGDTATNEFGRFYSVEKVPFRNVLQVLFLCQTSFLLPNANYSDLRELSLIACDELFGRGKIYQSVDEAWKAVNVVEDSSPKNLYSLDVTINLDSTKYCSKISVPSYSLTIFNDGIDDILKNTKIGYTIFYGTSSNEIQSLSDEIVLNADLPWGEELEIDLTGKLVLDFYGVVDIFVALSLGDPENFIAFDFENIRNFNSQKNDLSLEFYEFGLECSTKRVMAFYEVENQSCDPILAGAKISIQFKDGSQVVHVEDHTLSSNLAAGDYWTGSSFFSYTNRNVAVTATLIYSNDVNLSNNIVTDLHYNLIDGPKKFTFSDLDYKNYFSDRILSEDIYRSGNESYFATTGFVPNTNFIAPPCPELAHNFELEEAGYMSTCIDASRIGKTTISFDLI